MNKQISTGMEKDRYVMDPIYGLIYLPTLMWKIVDTPLFQRTRRIKQLGTAEYVFPNACHSRFSHMIGTSHLASKVCDHLHISGLDKTIIIISALTHDIGHSLLSHLYEQAGGSHHEERSALFIKYIVKYHVPELSEHVDKIVSGILGVPYDISKPYLSEIVSNKITGVDVDKLDYMVRDCYYTGVKSLVDIDRIISGMVITKDNHIGFKKKVLEDVANVFRTRYDLHRRVYQHRVVRIISAMFIEILREVHYEPKLEEGCEIKYIKEWTTFTDDWFEQLRLSKSDKILKIFDDIDNRRLWKCIQEFNVIGELTNTNNISDAVMDVSYISSGYKGNILCEDGMMVNLDAQLPKDITIVRYLTPS